MAAEESDLDDQLESAERSSQKSPTRKNRP
uniref:Uncharacterized protein n=1 Tax=Moniliophthora roreri TaxID=221103 RepID=A0A0W0G5D4_MONRR